MKVVLGAVVVLVLMIGAQSAFALTEYQLGFKRGVYDTTSNTPLKVAHDVIVEHGHAFYQGWLDGNCGYNQTAGGSDADEFTFDCSDANSSPPALTR